MYMDTENVEKRMNAKLAAILVITFYTYIWRMAAPISDDYYIITHRESVLYTMFSCCCCFFCFSIMACYFVLVVSSHFINAKTKAKIVICLCRVECKYETWKHKNAHTVLPPTTTIAIVGLLLLHRKCTQIVYTQQSRASSTPQSQLFLLASEKFQNQFRLVNGYGHSVCTFRIQLLTLLKEVCR